MARAANSAYPRFSTYTPYFGGVAAQPPINQSQIPAFARAHAMRTMSQVGMLHRQAAAVAAQTAGTATARDVANITSHQPLTSYAQQRANERTDRVRSEQKRREENGARRLGNDDAYYHDDPALPTVAGRMGDPANLTMQQRWEAAQTGVTPAQPIANFAHQGVQSVNPADVATHVQYSQVANDLARTVATSPRFGTETASLFPTVERPPVKLWTPTSRRSTL